MLVMETSGRVDEHNLLNGDVYLGNVKGFLPHGNGKYTWSDGTMYEGDWEGGSPSGKGKISWSSGATYEGEFAGGYLHGFGTLTGADGSVYVGTWRINVQHGIGRKQYSNSDLYEGSWKDGLQSGTGNYKWNNGNTYIGNWKCGKMCGQGVMKWTDGDFYDGFWLNGLRHGSGIYKFQDGGIYIGTWNKGLKDGRGTFYPTGSRHPSLELLSSLRYKNKSKRVLSHSSSLKLEKCEIPKSSIAKRSVSERISIGSLFRNSGRISHKSTLVVEDSNSCDQSAEFGSSDSSCTLSTTSADNQAEMQESPAVVYEREYIQGVLMKEKVILHDTEVQQKRKQRHKISMKEVKKSPRVDIFEGHRSYYLMLNLQLGIRYTVGKVNPVPHREVRPSDFGDQARIRMYFPRKGSRLTPPHYSIPFDWKDYCPMVFRNLRAMFRLDAADYMMSICGDDGLRELPSPGKSGSIFYSSHDDRFVIKTLKRNELKVLLRMLPRYYIHVVEYENTLVTKIFGLHEITLRGRRKIRFVVMGNMFFTELKVHKRYDLKGSTQGRFTEKEKVHEHTTLKDLDLQYEFQMDKSLRESFFRQITLDCKFLESQQIIDYSLLLGLHFRAPELEQAGLMPDGGDLNIPHGEAFDFPPKGLLLVTHEPSSVRRGPGAHIRGSSLRAFSVGGKEVDLFLPETGRLRLQLGVNMPAQARRKVEQVEINDTAEAELYEVFDVVLYMGIIDILQVYNLRKKVEQSYKSLHYDPMSISVIDPELYSKRFLAFLEKVFPDYA